MYWHKSRHAQYSWVHWCLWLFRAIAVFSHNHSFPSPALLFKLTESVSLHFLVTTQIIQNRLLPALRPPMSGFCGIMVHKWHEDFCIRFLVGCICGVREALVSLEGGNDHYMLKCKLSLSLSTYVENARTSISRRLSRGYSCVSVGQLG